MPSFKRLLIQTTTSLALISISQGVFAQPATTKINEKATAIGSQPKLILQKLLRSKGMTIKTTEQEAKEEAERLQNVSKRADNVFGLLLSEIAYAKGDTLPALLSYQVLLNRSGSPEIAERAVDLALENNAFDLADQALSIWKSIEPHPSTAQKQMLWERDIRMGRTEGAFSPLPELLKNANEMQVRRMYLQLAQLSMTDPEAASKGAKIVHQTATKYPEFSEAAIADILYSALDGNQKDAIKGLQRLSAADGDIRPATQLVLGIIAQKQPELLVAFFESTPSSKMSPMWQILEIETYMHVKNIDKAYELLKAQLISNPSPNPDLYIQAGYLAKQRKEPNEVVDGLYERAFTLGNPDQKSRAALMMSVFSFQDKNAEKGILWAKRIASPRLAFDKNLLLASAAAEKKDWVGMNKYLTVAQTLDSTSGTVFTNQDLIQLYFMEVAAATNPQQGLLRLNELLKAQQKNPKATVNDIADIYYQRAIYKSDILGQHTSAVEDLRQHLKMKPNDAEGMNALGYTLLETPNGAAEGLAFVKKAYLLLPDSPHVLDSMGWAYYKTGDLPQARTYLEQAYEAQPTDDVAAHLGEVLFKMGLKDESKAMWQEGLNLMGESYFKSKNAKQSILYETMKRFGVPIIPATKAAQPEGQ